MDDSMSTKPIHLVRVLDANCVRLRVIEEQDLEMVRNWRNDPKISQFMLSQNTISDSEQKQWFALVSSSKSQLHFIIEYKGTPIGVANLKALNSDSLINATHIEPGLYIFDDRYRGSFLAFCPAITLNDYCFEVLGCQYLVARVLPNNEAALRYNASLGYEKTNDNDGLITMQLTPQQYAVKSLGIRRFIRY